MAEENKNDPTGTIILGVLIHCERCRDEVIRSLRGFQGVEQIEVDAKNHKVTVKGKNADPTKVVKRLRKKTGKYVELISPILQPEEKKEETKTEEPLVVEVVLKMYIHCEGCEKDVKYRIHKMDGVRTVDVDMAKNQVTVKGTMDPQKLVEFVSKRSGKNAEILKQSDAVKVLNKEEENASCVQNYSNREMIYAPQLFNYSDHELPYVPQPFNYSDRELIYAPQLFSDENPNFCTVM